MYHVYLKVLDLVPIQSPNMYYGSLTVSENNREKFSDPISDVFNITLDQSIENAGVAFVKGADKRNEFFEKMNKQ